jgi:hypothetical protein
MQEISYYKLHSLGNQLLLLVVTLYVSMYVYLCVCVLTITTLVLMNMGKKRMHRDIQVVQKDVGVTGYVLLHGLSYCAACTL